MCDDKPKDNSGFSVKNHYFCIVKRINYNMAEVKNTELMRTSQSWDGAPLPAFPQENAEIVAMRYEFPPGNKLGWHHHDVINFGYVQQGELTIVDINGNVKVVHQGETIVEMVGTIHHGENNGYETVILHMFYVAPKGTPLSVQHPEIPTDQPFPANDPQNSIIRQ